MKKKIETVLFVSLFFLTFNVFAGTIQLPKTGQTTCYDSTTYYNYTNCVGTGQDGEFQAGLRWPYPARFNFSADCATDNLTGLMWSENANLTNGPINWQSALTYANQMALCGFSDWRLPNINEMESLFHSGQQFSNKWLESQGFLNVKNDYWTSTTSVKEPTYAWVVGLNIGLASESIQTYKMYTNRYYLWPVRGETTNPAPIWKTGQVICYDDLGGIVPCTGTGQDGDIATGIAWPTERFADSGDCVTDNLTGLMWSKNANLTNGPINWQSALTYANQMALCGFSDWRLPNRKELRSLIDYSKHDPAIPSNSQFFNVMNNHYWTNTSDYYYKYAAWVIDMRDGGVWNKTKTDNWYFWPVRSKIDHFEFWEIPSPQVVGKPFALTIEAIGTDGTLLKSFNQTVTIKSTIGNVKPSTLTFIDGIGNGEISIDSSGETKLYIIEMGNLGESNLFKVTSQSLLELNISLYNNPTERASYDNIFKRFGKAVYESSNGATKLNKINVYCTDDNLDKANVYWSQECHPSSPISGYGISGFHISFCDLFKTSNYNFLQDEDHQRGGGYTLAHELGHYYYSLYDEYKCHENKEGDCDYNNAIIHSPHSGDVPVEDSIMNNQFMATGTGTKNELFKWLNFSVSKNNTQKTAQHRVYDASGWETLARPISEDPRDEKRKALPSRLYHEELKQVAPEPGEYPNIDGDIQDVIISWNCQSTLSSKSRLGSPNLPFIPQVHSILGKHIQYPAPMLLMAFVRKEFFVTDMGIKANIVFPDGNNYTIDFLDDGKSPDAVSGDGIYSTIIPYNMNGIYTITVNFDNNTGISKFVTTALMPSIGPDGKSVPLPGPELVGQNFNLSKTIKILVTNVLDDDCGDNPSAAKIIEPNNIPISGKIEYPGDKDVFKLVTASNGLTYVRVNNLAFGLKPKVRIIGADKTTVLFEKNEPISGMKYIVIPLLQIPTNTTVYIEVSDNSSESYGGLYDISAGRRLPREFNPFVYLPLLVNGNNGSSAGFYVKLTWDRGDVDLDLNIWDSFWFNATPKNPKGIPGGLLEVTSKGWGPEVYRQITDEGSKYYDIIVKRNNLTSTNATVQIFNKENKLIKNYNKLLNDSSFDSWNVDRIVPRSNW